MNPIFQAAGCDRSGRTPCQRATHPRVIEALADFANPLSILTKSTMIVRDLDVLQRLDRAAPLTVSMSVGTLDESVRRVVEPGTPPGRKRLEILASFAAADIRTVDIQGGRVAGDRDRDEVPVIVRDCAG